MSLLKNTGTVFRHRITKKLFRLSGNYVLNCNILQEINGNGFTGEKEIVHNFWLHLLYKHEKNMYCTITGILTNKMPD